MAGSRVVTRVPFKLSTLLLLALGVVAGTSVSGALSGPAVWWSAIVGAAVAAISAALARLPRVLETEALGASLILFAVVGGFVVSSPAPDYQLFFESLTTGWTDLLSSVPPIVADNHYRVLPYALAWLGTAGGLALSRTVRLPAIGALVPVLVFGVGLLFSVELRSMALVQGACLTVGTLALGWLQQRELGFEVDETIGITTVQRRRQRFLKGAAMVLLVSSLAPVLATRVPGFDARERFDLRDRLEPPWNALDEPSPLAQLKANYRDGVENEVVFIVRGNDIPQRWRLAGLGLFDGEVWTVGDVSVAGNAPFVPIDTELPVDPQWTGYTELATDALRRSFEVEVLDSTAPWLPVPNRPFAFGSSGADLDIRFNAITRTAARPSGAFGTIYDIEAADEPTLSDLELRAATFPFPESLGISQQASNVRDWSADLVESRDRGWGQIEAVRDDLTAQKYLSDDGARPGHSWGRLQSFLNRDQVFGYEEQYAAAAGIAGRNAELNVRVVVGFLIDDAKLDQNEIEVTRTETSAWIEVLTVEHGWVAVDVTPDRDDRPALEQQGKRTQTVAAPNPPPPPPPPTDVEVERQEMVIDEPTDEEDEIAASGVPRFVTVGGAFSLPFVLVGGWAAAVVAAKTMRRRRRQSAPDPAERISGAWLELNDRLIETGQVPQQHESVYVRSSSVDAPAAVDDIAALARAVDVAVFGPNEPTDADSDEAWKRYDAASAALDHDVSNLERLRRRVRSAPLRRRFA